MTTRWVLTEVDTAETWTMPINPDSMSSPHRSRAFKHAYGLKGGLARVRTFQTTPDPVVWEWSGLVRTQEHYDALQEWAKKPGKIHVTDHLGRTFEVLLKSFEPTDRRPTGTVSWRLRYSMKSLLLRQVS